MSDSEDKQPIAARLRSADQRVPEEKKEEEVVVQTQDLPDDQVLAESTVKGEDVVEPEDSAEQRSRRDSVKSSLSSSRTVLSSQLLAEGKEAGLTRQLLLDCFSGSQGRG